MFQTSSAIQARITFAFVNIVRAIFAGITGETNTLIIFHLIDTGRVIDARIIGAIVYVHFAMRSGITGFRAIARIIIDAVLADAAILTRRRLTIVYIYITNGTRPTGRTLARIRRVSVYTVAFVVARIRIAFVNVDAAIFAGIAGRTNATKFIDAVNTGGAVRTRMR